jgi:uncharacterized protein
MDGDVFDRAESFAKEIFKGDSSGHDIYHTKRVHDLARTICSKEGGDMDIVRLAALLHDVDDRKLFGDNGYANARRFMDSENVDRSVQDTICTIIGQISFKGKDTVTPTTLEGKIVQDADRMDAIGAIGIARAFAYGGSKGRSIYVPDDAPKTGMTEEEYFSNQGTSVNHFYEKLLLLKDLMNTDTAKSMAQSRHDFMVRYLDEFYAEWEGRA